MPAQAHTLTHTLMLLARQTRMINASVGLRLEVVSGCLWLTRPGDAVDRFLVAGSSIELHESQVLIQSDRNPASQGLEAARYRLVPSAVQATEMQSAFAGQRPALLKFVPMKLRWISTSAC